MAGMRGLQCVFHVVAYRPVNRPASSLIARLMRILCCMLRLPWFVCVAYTSGNITNIGIEPWYVKVYFMFFSFNIRANGAYSVWHDVCSIQEPCHYYYILSTTT